MAKLINRKSIGLPLTDIKDGYVPRWNGAEKQWEGVEFDDSDLFSPYDIPFSIPMIEPNGRRSFIVNVDGEINPFQPGYAYAETTPANTVVFKIYRNQFHIGNVDFVPGVNIGTIDFFSGVSFFEGNRFTIEAPSDVEGIENVTIALQGRILLPMQEAPEWEDFIYNQFLNLSGVDPEGALAQQVQADLQPGGSLYTEFGPDGQFLTNAGFITWGFLIFQDYINTNGDGFTPEQREDFILKLQPFYVDADNNQSPLYNQFSPYRGGSGETDSSFIFAFPFNELNEIQITKSGDSLQWHLDRTYTQNNSPTATGSGVIFLTTTDGFDGVTGINFGNNDLGSALPALPFVNLETLDASQTTFVTLADTEFITHNLTYLNIQNGLLNIDAHDQIYNKLFVLYEEHTIDRDITTILNTINEDTLLVEGFFNQSIFNYTYTFLELFAGTLNSVARDDSTLVVEFSPGTGGFGDITVDLEYSIKDADSWNILGQPKSNDDASPLEFNISISPGEYDVRLLFSVGSALTDKRSNSDSFEVPAGDLYTTVLFSINIDFDTRLAENIESGIIDIPIPVPPASAHFQGSRFYIVDINGNLWTGGLGDNNTRLYKPELFPSAGNWKEVGGGTDFVLLINNDGELYAFGSNSFRQTGIGPHTGTTEEITRVGTDSDWDKLAIIQGNFVGGAIKQNGDLYTWGRSCQVINNFSLNNNNFSLNSRRLPTLHTVTGKQFSKILITSRSNNSSTNSSALALSTDGDVYGVGRSFEFSGAFPSNNETPWTKINELENIDDISGLSTTLRVARRGSDLFYNSNVSFGSNPANNSSGYELASNVPENIVQMLGQSYLDNQGNIYQGNNLSIVEGIYQKILFDRLTSNTNSVTGVEKLYLGNGFLYQDVPDVEDQNRGVVNRSMHPRSFFFEKENSSVPNNVIDVSYQFAIVSGGDLLWLNSGDVAVNNANPFEKFLVNRSVSSNQSGDRPVVFALTNNKEIYARASIGRTNIGAFMLRTNDNNHNNWLKASHPNYLAIEGTIDMGATYWVDGSAGTNSAGLLVCNSKDVYAWGFNLNGRFGNGETNSSFAPLTLITTIENIKKVVISNSVSAILTNSGNLYVGGTYSPDTNGEFSEVGNGEWIDVSAANDYILAIKENEVFAWGNPPSGITLPAEHNPSTPYKIADINNCHVIEAQSFSRYGLIAGSNRDVYIAGTSLLSRSPLGFYDQLSTTVSDAPLTKISNVNNASAIRFDRNGRNSIITNP